MKNSTIDCNDNETNNDNRTRKVFVYSCEVFVDSRFSLIHTAH